MNVLRALHEHEEHQPRNTSHRRQPPAADGSAIAPTVTLPYSGHRPRWSDLTKIFFFSNPKLPHIYPRVFKEKGRSAESIFRR
ncbi:hypothetical protein V6N11_075035 [Hibiscus sabdariffa]|uniref:Uncharacterized protein n=1 Tax=Hibiscus sabdariffa TaxID=183260 RepID=A0ABR2R5A4_9ROSI